MSMPEKASGTLKIVVVLLFIPKYGSPSGVASFARDTDPIQESLRVPHTLGPDTPLDVVDDSLSLVWSNP